MRKQAAAAAVASVATAWLLAAPVAAHPSPAEPPAFDNEPRLVVVDKQEQTSWHLEYSVPVEDTEMELDHVTLPDSKTHQFFAVSGRVVERAMAHELLPFDAPLGTPIALPTWLSSEDVARTEEGVVPEDQTNFTADQVAPEDVLEPGSELAARIVPLAGETQRVPITMAQAAMGADWNLQDVPVGPYQIVAYIFSPPFNGWAVRPGLVHVVDGDQRPPALSLYPVSAQLFEGQGRRIRGCVDAPEGSTLHVALRPRGEPETPFEPWIESVPVDGPEYDVCLRNPGKDVTYQVRVEVRTPDGESMLVHTAETISMFSSHAPCLDSERICCEEPPSDAGMDAGTPGDPEDGGVDGSPAPEAPGSSDASAVDAADEDRAPRPGGEAGEGEGSGGGCRGAPGAPTSAAWGLFVAALAVLRARRVHSRLPR